MDKNTISCIKNKIKIFFLNSLLLISINVQAQDYYDSHEKGWHWYDEEVEKTSPINTPNNDPVAQMESVKKTLTYALDNALLNPTSQNVQHYISLQNQWAGRSSLFSQVWQSVLLEHPALDYSLTFPTNNLGRQVYTTLNSVKEDAAIANLAKRQGLFFFYRSNCPYCQRFAPVLKTFTQRYHIKVIPITTNSIALPEFPDTRIDQGQARKFNINLEPALFTVDPYSQKAIPVSYGLLSEQELKQRILTIAQHVENQR